MFNVRLAGDHLSWKWLFTWLPLVMSLMVSDFVLSIFLEMESTFVTEADISVQISTNILCRSSWVISIWRKSHRSLQTGARQFYYGR